MYEKKSNIVYQKKNYNHQLKAGKLIVYMWVNYNFTNYIYKKNLIYMFVLYIGYYIGNSVEMNQECLKKKKEGKKIC